MITNTQQLKQQQQQKKQKLQPILEEQQPLSLSSSRLSSFNIEKLSSELFETAQTLRQFCRTSLLDPQRNLLRDRLLSSSLVIVFQCFQDTLYDDEVEHYELAVRRYLAKEVPAVSLETYVRLYQLSVEYAKDLDSKGNHEQLVIKALIHQACRDALCRFLSIERLQILPLPYLRLIDQIVHNACQAFRSGKETEKLPAVLLNP